jgi:hypothetical protein
MREDLRIKTNRSTIKKESIVFYCFIVLFSVSHATSVRFGFVSREICKAASVKPGTNLKDFFAVGELAREKEGFYEFTFAAEG